MEHPGLRHVYMVCKTCLQVDRALRKYELWSFRRCFLPGRPDHHLVDIRFKLKLRPTATSPEGDSAALIRERAVAKGVLALPGTAFFPNGQTSAYVRAAFSLLEPEDADEAMKRLALVIKEYNAEGEQM